MIKKLSLFSTQVVVCASASALFASMLPLDGLNAFFAGVIVFGVLVLITTSVAPEDEDDARRHSEDASALASHNSHTSDASGGADASGD